MPILNGKIYAGPNQSVARAEWWGSHAVAESQTQGGALIGLCENEDSPRGFEKTYGLDRDAISLDVGAKDPGAFPDPIHFETPTGARPEMVQRNWKKGVGQSITGIAVGGYDPNPLTMQLLTIATRNAMDAQLLVDGFSAPFTTAYQTNLGSRALAAKTIPANGTLEHPDGSGDARTFDFEHLQLCREQMDVWGVPNMMRFMLISEREKSRLTALSRYSSRDFLPPNSPTNINDIVAMADTSTPLETFQFKMIESMRNATVEGIAGSGGLQTETKTINGSSVKVRNLFVFAFGAVTYKWFSPPHFPKG